MPYQCKEALVVIKIRSCGGIPRSCATVQNFAAGRATQGVLFGRAKGQDKRDKDDKDQGQGKAKGREKDKD
jgi:hypothetical protein